MASHIYGFALLEVSCNDKHGFDGERIQRVYGDVLCGYWGFCACHDKFELQCLGLKG